MEILKNYYTFLELVNGLCSRITAEFSGQLACHPGCDSCCRHISLFWVEAVALAAAVKDLPYDEAIRVREAAASSAGEPCPLLNNDLCLLYAARPIICRTHGLPILALRDGKRAIDFCPLNFRNLDALPGRAVIDLDQLNTTLAAINALFTAEYFKDTRPAIDRPTIAEALLIEL